ncbi:chaoptin-like [Sitophilus oryzae]|uniref:Chaoptin-like n=1 Tax=Sitophilus oryzae TaxID=7048 RepID=A0A6J2XAK4_SITOR|nr:chaoptin-like [Sitophilus oryzae]
MSRRNMRLIINIIACLCLILLPRVLTEQCSHTIVEKNLTIHCNNLSVEEYLDNMFEMRVDIGDFLQDNSTNISIELDQNNFTHIDEWIYLPWEERLENIFTLRITNSSINTVRSLSKFRFLETLDLSSNNISDYNFLNRMKRLKYLHLGYNNFSDDSFLFDYIRRETTNLTKLDLRHSNITNFTIPYGVVNGYDLSYNINLKMILFENTPPDIRLNLNLSGNTNLTVIKNKVFDSYYICLSSIDLSNSHNNFSDILKNVRPSHSISLKNNYLPNLNETTFNLTHIYLDWCISSLGLSIDLSNVSMQNISAGFFNSRQLNYLNLSFNNLTKLEHSFFDNSSVTSLNLSYSNISSIGSNVFKNTNVKTIDLSRNSIISLDGVINQIFSIKEALLGFNLVKNITKAVFKKCRNLELVDLSSVYTDYVGKNVFATLPSMKYLTVSFKGFLNLPEVLNMHVLNLTIVNSKLDRLNSSSFKGFYKLAQLTFINCSVTGISENAFKGLYSLKYLDFKGLNAPSIDPKIFKPLKALEDLNLSNLNLKKINSDLSELYSLKNLNLSSNSLVLEQSAFTSLKKLEVLSLANNKLSTIPVGIFWPLEKLTHLYLNNNAFQQLSPGVFSGLGNLTLLDLSHNGLYRTKLHILLSISVGKMEFLYLQNNNLGSEYAHEDSNLRKNEFKMISNHASLKNIDINNNEWQCTTLVDLISNFMSKNISCLPTDPEYKTTNINGIRCTYLDNMFELRVDIGDLLQDNSTNISIELDQKNCTHIDEWIYLPWEERLENIVTLRIPNLSINTVRSLSKFRFSETLGSSTNNISDYNFLNRMKKLKYLHLGYTNFSDYNFLFDYIRRETTNLTILDLRHSNITNITVPYGVVNGYDLSYNMNLKMILFENTLPDIRLNLNLSGNTNLTVIKNKVFESYYFCLSSIDLSNSHNNFSNILKNVRPSHTISLKNNYLPNLNETTFNLTHIYLDWCISSLGLSIDLSNVSMQNISAGFFNSRQLNYLNLSFNNLTKLGHSFFDNSSVTSLNLSYSNISSIGSNVFKNTNVKTIDLSRNSIISLDGVINQIFSIKEALLGFNLVKNITKAVFKKCRNLELVDLSSVYTDYVGKNVFATLPSMKYLTVSFKGFLNLPEVLNMHVLNLTIVNSKLDRLNSSSFKGFYKLAQLTFINCSVTGISENAFKGLYSLKYLDFKGLNTPSIDPKIFKPLKALADLNLSNLNLKKINSDLSELYSLKNLNLSSNSLVLEQSAFTSLKKLEVLSLANNKLSTIPVGIFWPLEKLTHLYLNNNAFQQLSPGVFSGLGNLTLLDLSHNGLYRTKLHILLSISVGKMEFLYLQNNNLGSEYAHEDSNLRKNEFKMISNHASLKNIDINNNEWQCTTLVDLISNFMSKNISCLPTDPEYKTTNINGIRCTV